MASRAVSLYTLLLTLVLALGACKKDDFALETTAELSSLADRIVQTVEEAQDKKAGVNAAQKLLDEKSATLGPKMKELEGMRELELSEDVLTKVKTVRTEADRKVAGLEMVLIAQLATDEELEKDLETLIASFNALINGEQPGS